MITSSLIVKVIYEYFLFFQKFIKFIIIKILISIYISTFLNLATIQDNESASSIDSKTIYDSKPDIICKQFSDWAEKVVRYVHANLANHCEF